MWDFPRQCRRFVHSFRHLVRRQWLQNSDGKGIPQ